MMSKNLNDCYDNTTRRQREENDNSVSSAEMDSVCSHALNVENKNQYSTVVWFEEPCSPCSLNEEGIEEKQDTSTLIERGQIKAY